MGSYAEVTARNSNQSAEEASAPSPPQIVSTSSLSSSDIASISTDTGGSIPDETSSGPGGVRVVQRSELNDLDTSDVPVIQEPGPTITVNPVLRDETGGPADEGNRLEDTMKCHRNLSEREKQVVVFGGVGSVNALAVGLIGYFGWKRYHAGENGWKILGIAIGTFAGLTAVQYLGVRYRSPTLANTFLRFFGRDANFW
jgi:hypothetical protein